MRLWFYPVPFHPQVKPDPLICVENLKLRLEMDTAYLLQPHRLASMERVTNRVQVYQL